MAKILDKINSPQDLHKLSLENLAKLCEEIRQEIIEVISKNGGHLASSLGAVELIVALHYVFDTPEDKIIFDVGHQSYAHKILTGRQKGFKDVRKQGGVSGFPKRNESPYDAFDTGHSSTSISAGLGLAAAANLNKTGRKTIAVIGDAALTGGMALEALNDAGNLKNNFIVILNDNQMSISPNVGALSSYLSIRFTSQKHIQKREKFKDFLKKILPKKYKFVIYTIQKIEESLKRIFVSASSFFEAWGFKYIGPINGHDLLQLIRTLENLKNINRPLLLHISTIKGKGYQPAEKDPASFHGVSQESLNGKLNETVKNGKKKAKSYTDVFGQKIVELAQKNDKIVAITAAMSQGTGLNKFFKAFPHRAFDVGIAEQHAVTFAAGMALGGLKPIVAIYSTFLQRAFDQLYHDVALQDIPVIFAIDRAGFVGEDGPTHHGILDLSYLNLMPNFVIMAPQNGPELEDMLTMALTLNNPVAIRYPRGEIIEENNTAAPIELGKGIKLKNGSDLSILALGSTVWPALKASEKLKEENNIEASVLNLRFLKPFDKELVLKELAENKKIITVEENLLAGGLGTIVNQLIIENKLENIEIINLAISDLSAQHDSQGKQRELFLLDEQGIYKTALKMLSLKKI